MYNIPIRNGLNNGPALGLDIEARELVEAVRLEGGAPAQHEEVAFPEAQLVPVSGVGVRARMPLLVKPLPFPEINGDPLLFT